MMLDQPSRSRSRSRPGVSQRCYLHVLNQYDDDPMLVLLTIKGTEEDSGIQATENPYEVRWLVGCSL
jgi:hypothetical protein